MRSPLYRLNAPEDYVVNNTGAIVSGDSSSVLQGILNVVVVNM